jgi:hypothetical protein
MSGRVRGAGGYPTIGTRIVPSASVQSVTTITLATPDNHVTASPHCRMFRPGVGHVDEARRCPRICTGIVPPSCVHIGVAVALTSAPDDHLTASPYCSVTASSDRGISGACRYPTIRGWIIPPPSVLLVSAPHNHFAASPYCAMSGSSRWRVDRTCSCPTVRIRIVSPAGIKRRVKPVPSAPNDHFAASPYCSVKLSCSGRIGRAGREPAIGAWIVSPACVCSGEVKVESTPDDHFTAGPHCLVKVSSRRGVGGAGGCPTICSGIVPPAVAAVVGANSAPNDHFAACPHCRVKAAARGGIGHAGGCPNIGSASSHRIRYRGKSVVGVRNVVAFGLNLRSRVFQRQHMQFRNGEVTVDQCWPCQTLRDDKGIVAERLKQFPQDFGLFCVAGHPVHFGL